MGDLQLLHSFLSTDQIKLDSESRKAWGKDWTTYFDIDAQAVLFPATVEQVQKIVQWALKTNTALVPSGGRTGLSGGAVASRGEVVVSFDRMNQLKGFNEVDSTLVVGPGVITEAIQNFAKSKGLFYPVDFAARGSSQIGGNIATNAGGIKVLRYGLTRDWVTSLQVVTGTGEILNLNNNLIKNATGYDLRHLFIGSEGTLGFVTEATLQLTQPPRDQKVVFFAVPDLLAIMKIFSIMKNSNTLMAFEFLSGIALQKVIESTQLSQPFSQSHPFYVLMEVEINSEQDEQVLLECYERAAEQQLILDGAIAQSDQQAKVFWKYREDISESLARFSPYKNDISVTIEKVPAFVGDLESQLKKSYPQWEVVWFGHIGDGNLHINILRPEGMRKEEFVKECQQVDQLLFEIVQKNCGSISAEHGVGLTKKPFLSFTRSPAEIEIMKSIKKVFDPHNIINPGKLF